MPRGNFLILLAVAEARSWLGQTLILPLILFFGRGRFGQVHKCEEKSTGLKLAAKIIKTRGTKDKVKAVVFQCGSPLAVVFTSLSILPSS